MRIHKMSNQHNIAFTEPEGQQENPANNIENKQDSKPVKPQAAKKLNNADVINIRGTSGILSAGGGSIKNDKGSGKYLGSETNNSIWNSDLLENIKGQETNQDRIVAEREAIEKTRKGMRQEELDRLSEHLNETDTRKDSSIYSTSGAEGHSYRSSENNLSIFDTNKFDDMPDQTEGEKVAEKARQPKEKDDSWRHNYGTKKINSCLDNLFEHLQDIDND